MRQFRMMLRGNLRPEKFPVVITLPPTDHEPIKVQAEDDMMDISDKLTQAQRADVLHAVGMYWLEHGDEKPATIQ